ncbi:hypothetical protein HIM_04386 [Hirsutella minnesotensis 3608]|uniref:Aminoglycoside phosphotransferase domain-containing protein n=1 Tax=Hirsutella minnesotensis 3608 TaxID=1043627 RepID=A0A0F8A618_9HYPO|nr:hypothetical protein HIM_04386 [Hirsutella minnesotensis 3608]
MAPSFEEFDDQAWNHGEELFHSWKSKLYDKDLYYEIVRKVVKHRLGGDALELCAPQKGAFNVYYRVRFAEGPGAMIRFPIPAYFQYTEEKLLGEVAAMRYIGSHTTIPIPFLLHHGMPEESPGHLGPFTIMEWVENAGDLVDVVNTPGLTLQDPPVLDPDIDEAKLEYAYSQMADVLLQLSQCKHPIIGSLGFPDDDDQNDPEVLKRPLSLNIAQLANFARVPHFELPPLSTTYQSSSKYYAALADMHLQQLSYQRNDAIESADDCRKKYIARQLFRKLAAESRLADEEFEQGPFPLWCDDLRPANVLVDGNDKITAVIDWEFTYAAPADFTFSPPWWLLLKAPDDWKAGLDDWVAHYEPRLETFLRVLKAKENSFVQQGRLKESDILSFRMEESWRSGRFWVSYAARRTWAFDAIYWQFLDEKFFGKLKNGDFRERIKLLPQDQVDAMEDFVQRKVAERQEGTLTDWYTPDAQSRLPTDVLSGNRGHAL